MKYILFKDFSGEPVPVIFPARVNFEEMREQIPYSEAISAGFVQLRGGVMACHGEAKDLGLTARPEDGAIITAKLTDVEE